MSYDEDEAFEHTLLVVREVSVYKIPPRGSSGGYKCAEWLQSDKIWSGRLKVISLKDKCEVRLEDSNTGELFAACPVLPGKRDTTVESVTDSSRYFVLRIDDGRGKHAFIGLGFTERNEAFDFNVALSDHEKYLKRETEKEDQGIESESRCGHPALDLRLKAGETIRINVKTRPTSGTGMLSSATSSGPVNTASTKQSKGPLLLPPGGGRIRSPLPPPPNDTRSGRSNLGYQPGNPSVPSTNVSSSSLTTSQLNVQDRKSDYQRAGSEPFPDLSQLEMALPSASRSSTKAGSTGSSNWAAF